MIKNVNSYLSNIPQLPKIVIELESFRKADSKSSKQLANIIKNDLELHSLILKVMDFDIFYFNEKPRSIQNFVIVTNIEFVSTLALSLAIIKTIKSNLFSYAVTMDDFLYSNTLAMRLVDLWIGKISKNLKNELLLPAFLQDISKPIISLIINENKLTEQFLKELSDSHTISEVEKQFLGLFASRISANILKNWELSYNIIFPIAFSDDLTNCPLTFKRKALILNVLKIVCNIREPFKESLIKKVVSKLDLYKLETKPFLEACEEIKGSKVKNI